MPSEVRLFVRTSLLCFTLAVLLGAGMVAARHLAGWQVPWSLVVVHTHVALVGGMLLMIVGVACWMFPLDRERFPETRGRYRPGLVRAVYGLLVGGLALRVVVEPLQGERSGGFLGLLLVAAAGLQALGMVLFLVVIRSRIRRVTMP
jgi:hypothetical protein